MHLQTDDKQRLVGAAAAIPRDAVYAVGMDVKLTVNVCPGMGLCNGSRGIVADIIYPGEAGYVRPPGVKSQDAAVFPIIIVDFADYIGPPLLECVVEAGNHPRLVPVMAVECRCDRGCCARYGIPLRCGKADTVHSAQGVTIGRGKALERCLLHWSLDAEGKWPGVFYVGASRVKTIDCLALHNPFNRSDAVSVGRGDAAVRSREAMDRIADAANEQVAQRDTARTFEAGLAWFCAHVKEQVRVQLQESTDDDRTSQLSDVMVVCDEWSKDYSVSNSFLDRST